MLFFLYCVQVFFNDFESVPIDPPITGINLVVHSIYVSAFLSASLVITYS